jgi:hypothetical protein
LFLVGIGSATTVTRGWPSGAELRLQPRFDAPVNRGDSLGSERWGGGIVRVVITEPNPLFAAAYWYAISLEEWIWRFVVARA